LIQLNYSGIFFRHINKFRDPAWPDGMRKVWIALTIITVSTVIFLYAHHSAAYRIGIQMLDVLHLTPRHEQFTELYFYNIVPLLKTRGDAETHFSFTIHNLEGREVDYRYRIFLGSSTAQQHLLDSGTIHLDDQTATTAIKTFHLSDLKGDETIVVTLPDFEQQIHFRLFPHS
jgi:hypothetical protein